MSAAQDGEQPGRVAGHLRAAGTMARATAAASSVIGAAAARGRELGDLAVPLVERAARRRLGRRCPPRRCPPGAPCSARATIWCRARPPRTASRTTATIAAQTVTARTATVRAVPIADARDPGRRPRIQRSPNATSGGSATATRKQRAGGGTAADPPSGDRRRSPGGRGEPVADAAIGEQVARAGPGRARACAAGAAR